MTIGNTGRDPFEIREEIERKIEKEGIYTPNDKLLEGVLVHATIPLFDNEWVINRRQLCEHHGYLNNIDDYMLRIKTFVKAKMSDAEEGQTYKFVMDEQSFRYVKNNFFDTCTITMFLSIDPTSEISVGGESKVDFIKLNDGKFNKHVVINVYGNAWNLYRLSKTVTTRVAHELTHCYEDIMRSTKNATSLRRKANLSNYNGIMYLHNFRDEAGNLERYTEYAIETVEKLGGLLYVCYKPEINAFVSELHAEMKEYEGNLKTVSDAIKLMEKTEVWGIVKRKDDFVKSLSNVQDSETRKLLVQSLNYVFGNGTVSNYGEFIKFVKGLWGKAIKTYKEKFGKICYDIFQEKNDTEILGGSGTHILEALSR